MKNNYLKRAALIAGAALLGTGAAMADQVWKDVTGIYLKNPGHIAGWRGALTATAEGVGECYNGAFELYQTLYDMPAGEYTLTCNAFARYTNAWESATLMQDGKNNPAYIFINGTEKQIASLYDGHALAEFFDAENNYIWGVVPNSLGEANTAFSEGKYLNTITVNHEGGDLKIGIRSYGGRQDQWTAFDNFKLTGPDGDVTDKIVNADFSTDMEGGTDSSAKSDEAWENTNSGNSKKYPDKNRAGGVYRKMGGSPYNTGQLIENLPAGTYRFGVQSFMRYGNGNSETEYMAHKAEQVWNNGDQEGPAKLNDYYTPLYLHKNNLEKEEWAAYIYITDGWDLAEDEETKIKPQDEECAQYGKEDAVYNTTPIMCIYDEDLEVYPDNNTTVVGEPNADGYGWCDSGFEYQAAACFVKNPTLYRNYVTIELKAAGNVWVGIKKDENNCYGYWNPWRDYTFEVLAEEAGVDNVAVKDADAPVEYYNLSGVRVANPANGIYIVKQGNKVSKTVIR